MDAASKLSNFKLLPLIFHQAFHSSKIRQLGRRNRLEKVRGDNAMALRAPLSVATGPLANKANFASDVRLPANSRAGFFYMPILGDVCLFFFSQ